MMSEHVTCGDSVSSKSKDTVSLNIQKQDNKSLL